MEAALDELIKDCAHQLFELTDDKENAKYPFSSYVSYQDIHSIQSFQEQIVIAIKAPEETKLEVPAPKEDCIEVHIRSTKGPIDVYLCEVEQANQDGNTFENMDTLSCETKLAAPADEGKVTEKSIYSQPKLLYYQKYISSLPDRFKFSWLEFQQ
uniref:E2F transcription factor CC-MB domain-containing protein n=1 Tax=Sphenodon punctatus TaxID=8508 RepID=A0A8D0L198_SPHPU